VVEELAAQGAVRARLDRDGRIVISGGAVERQSFLQLSHICWLAPEIVEQKLAAQRASLVAGRKQIPRAERDARLKALRKKLIRLQFEEESLVIESDGERRVDADPLAILGVTFAKLPPFEQRFDPLRDLAPIGG
jgi:hypothetical protein